MPAELLFQMRKSPSYPLEFLRQMVELVRAGRSPEALAKEFEPTSKSIREWVARAPGQAGSCQGWRRGVLF